MTFFRDKEVGIKTYLEHNLSHHLEIEIHQMLKDGYQPHDIAKDLLQRIGIERMTTETKLRILNFAHNCGYSKGVANYIKLRIERSKNPPWGLFAHMIFEAGIPYSRNLADYMFEGAQVHKSLADLVEFQNWDSLDPRFKELRKSVKNSLKKNLSDKRDRLIEKIKFMREQRILEQEKLAIDQLTTLFPDDPFLKDKENHFELRWAQDIIRKRASANREARIEKQSIALDNEQKKWVSEMKKNLPDLLKNFPDQAYNIAITFKMMELPALAVIALQSAPKEEDCEWLLIETLIEMGRAVVALDAIHNIEKSYASKPGTSFAANYLRAQALWKLEEKQLAISIISSIIKIRPQYRSATALLSQWMGETHVS